RPAKPRSACGQTLLAPMVNRFRQELLDIAFREPIRPAEYGDQGLQARTKGSFGHPCRQWRSCSHPALATAKSLELVFGNGRLERGQLSDLVAQGRGIAARDWTPTVYAVGGLTDVQLVDLRDG